MLLNLINCKEGNNGFNQVQKYFSEFVNMTSAKVDDMKDERVPGSMFWNVEDVANWIEGLGYPCYKVIICLDKCPQMLHFD